MEDYIVLGLTFVNIILTAMLVSVYYKSHRTVKSPLTLGMVFFAGAFLLENIMNFYFYSSILQAGVYGTTVFHLVVAFVEMIALMALLYVTWK
jgi:hypothetical protein